MGDPVTTVIGLALTAAGTGYTIHSGEEAKKDAKKRARIQAQQRQLEIRRQRAELARQSRIRRAAVVNTAANTGAMTTSMYANAAQGILSRERGERTYLDMGLDLAFQGDQISKNQVMRDASAYQMKNVITGARDISSTLPDITSLFSSPTVSSPPASSSIISGSSSQNTIR